MAALPLSRRSLLAAGVSGGAAFCLGIPPGILTAENRSAEPVCMLNGEQTEGPYYIDRKMVRRDITEGKLGLPLRLRVTVLDATRCTPLRNAAVDLWHCDSLGTYSGFSAVKLGPPPQNLPPPSGSFPPPGGPTRFLGSPPHHQPNDKKTFLRGVQLTGGNGVAEFATIYPGWYSGRCVHIHLKVWTGGNANSQAYRGGHECHTGQLYFPEDITTKVSELAPYRTHDEPRIRTTTDGVFTLQGGPECIVQVAQESKRSLSDGLVATTVVGVKPIDRS